MPSYLPFTVFIVTPRDFIRFISIQSTYICDASLLFFICYRQNGKFSFCFNSSKILEREGRYGLWNEKRRIAPSLYEKANELDIEIDPVGILEEKTETISSKLTVLKDDGSRLNLPLPSLLQCCNDLSSIPLLASCLVSLSIGPHAQVFTPGIAKVSHSMGFSFPKMKLTVRVSDSSVEQNDSITSQPLILFIHLFLSFSPGLPTMLDCKRPNAYSEKAK